MLNQDRDNTRMVFYAETAKMLGSADSATGIAMHHTAVEIRRLPEVRAGDPEIRPFGDVLQTLGELEV